MVIKCPKCNHFVSNVATICPHCGYNFRDETPEPQMESAAELDSSPDEPEEMDVSEIAVEQTTEEVLAANEYTVAATEDIATTTEKHDLEAYHAPRDRKNRKWLYIFGVVAVLAAGGCFGIKKYMNDSVNVQLLPSLPVVWDKFVTPISSAHIYDQPDINMLLTDEEVEKGYIVPVIEDTQNFYKVYLGYGKEGWVKKNQWREVVVEPITQEMATEIFLSGEHLDNITRNFDEGDLKDLMLCYHKNYNSAYLDVGILDNGRLIRPLNPSVEAIPVDGSAFSVIPATDSESCRIEFGTNYQITEETFQQFLDFSKLSKRQIAEIWKTAQGSNPYKVEVTYYFATERAVRTYDLDLSVYGSDASNSSRLVEEGNARLSNFTYAIESMYDSDSETTFYQLNVVTASGEKINTEIADGAAKLTLLAQGDYDGDGEREAIVYEWGGGNSVQPPYLVYYDKDEEVFKKVEGFDYISEDPEIKIEDWNDQTSFVTTVGLRHDRYVYSNHSLTIAERILPDVGTRVATIPLIQLFKADSDDGVSRSIYIDIDGDGSTEKLIFYHDTSHASDWGHSMKLMKIEADNWSIPTNEDESLGVSGNTFIFLGSKNGIVPDILCDDAWLYKWNGDKFVTP